MTFDAPVTVTGDPTFAFDLGGATTATYYAGSGTTTLRFSHAVSGGTSGDRDTNGISWAENAIALNGGTIAGTDNGVYPGFPTLFWGLSGFFVNDLMGKALWSSWKTRSVFQGAVGAFCASTAPSASTGPICMRQDRRVLGLQSTRE